MNGMRVLIIDYGVGNHQSVFNALNFLGYNVLLSGNKEDIARAKAYILPGVGAFAEAMKNLRRMKVIDLLKEQILSKKKPILGICLGMQLLADYSEENGLHKGMGLIEGRVVKLESQHGFRVPHVGWSDINIIKRDPIFNKNEDKTHFYFDHSYHFICNNKYISATCRYGKDIVASLQKDNIYGVQFHPEKSQNNGLKLFRSFLNYIQNIESIAY